VLVTTVLLATFVVLVAVEPALADPNGATKDVGEGIGDLLKGWAKALIPGIVAIVAVPAIARHDFAQAISILIVALLVGGFAFMSDDVLTDIIGGTWTTITGGGS
jgi:hypothetical protein